MKVTYFKYPWKSQTGHLKGCESRRQKVVGRTAYVDVLITDVAILHSAVPFGAPTVRLQRIISLIRWFVQYAGSCIHLVFFCPLVLMAQVMTRMRLTWLGEYSNSRSKKSTCRKVLCVVFTYVFIIVGLTVVEEFGFLKYVGSDWKYRLKETYFPVIKTISFVFFSLWALYALCMTRESVRVRYSIRQKPYYCGCEDLCCSAFCPCLTVAQLARHTGEYETYPASCCTQTGHPRGTPRL
jgi:Cys-rich protein (TIGR01571 family)